MIIIIKKVSENKNLVKNVKNNLFYLNNFKTKTKCINLCLNFKIY